MVGDEVVRRWRLLTGGFRATRSLEGLKYDEGNGSSPGFKALGAHGIPIHQHKLRVLPQKAWEGAMRHPHHGDWGQPSLIQKTAEQLQWPEPCAQPFTASSHFSLG